MSLRRVLALLVVLVIVAAGRLLRRVILCLVVDIVKVLDLMTRHGRTCWHIALVCKYMRSTDCKGQAYLVMGTPCEPCVGKG